MRTSKYERDDGGIDACLLSRHIAVQFRELGGSRSGATSVACVSRATAVRCHGCVTLTSIRIPSDHARASFKSSSYDPCGQYVPFIHFPGDANVPVGGNQREEARKKAEAKKAKLGSKPRESGASLQARQLA